VCDADERLGGVDTPIERVNLVAEPVEALQERVELPVVQVLSLAGHEWKGTVRAGRDDAGLADGARRDARGG
jgi:hypothetical protein